MISAVTVAKTHQSLPVIWHAALDRDNYEAVVSSVVFMDHTYAHMYNLSVFSSTIRKAQVQQGKQM